MYKKFLFWLHRNSDYKYCRRTYISSVFLTGVVLCKNKQAMFIRSDMESKVLVEASFRLPSSNRKVNY